jgi:hypothetical protein
MKNSDQYFYVVNKPMDFNTKCGELSNNITLNGTGFITINDSCSMFNQFLRIESQSTISVYKNLDFIKNSFIPLEINKFDQHKFITNNKELFDVSKEFDNIKHKLKYDQTFENLTLPLDLIHYVNVNKIHSGINFSTTIILCIIIAVCIYWYYKSNKKKNKLPDIRVSTYFSEDRVDHDVTSDHKPILKKPGKSNKA